MAGTYPQWHCLCGLPNYCSCITSWPEEEECVQGWGLTFNMELFIGTLDAPV